MTAVLKINEELNGIELYFQSKPESEVLTNLKSNGFRWSGFKKCWYTKQSATALQVANSLVNNEDIKEVSELTITKTTATKTAKKIDTVLSLWNATRFENVNINHDIKEKGCKEIAKELRSHIKKRFPSCKFSVTVPYYGRISFTIKSSPFEKGSTYLNAVKEYCSNLLNAYKVCYSESDPYTDYAGSYNFTGWAEIDWQYTQTEVTEEVKEDMKEFDIKLAELEKAEKEREEKEFQEYLKQEELRNQEYNKRREEEKKQTENILNSVDINSLDEKEQYFILGSQFADLNKNNTLDEYKEEVEKGKYSLEDVKITKEIHFNNLEALENFSNMLLHEFDFLTNTGGSFTDDNRINSMTDFHNMESEERKTVKWNRYGVAIYLNGQLQFIVDAQGYSYARYVGLVDNVTTQKEIVVNQLINRDEINELKQQADILESISADIIQDLNIVDTWYSSNWSEYKEALKNELKRCNFKLTKQVIQQLEIDKLKQSMYRLLVEVDGIQEQFKNVEIQQGEKLTLFYISDFGSVVTSRITFDSVEPSKYAQYDNAIKLTFTPEKKRKLHYKYFYSTLLVFKGWHILPETVLNNVEERNGFRLISTKYHSCDNKQYDEILSYFENQGLKPIVNTYKPTM